MTTASSVYTAVYLASVRRPIDRREPVRPGKICAARADINWYRSQVESCSVHTAYKFAVGKGNYNTGIGGSDVEENIGIGQVYYEIAGSSSIGINRMGGR